MLKESCTSRDDLAKCFKELQALMDLNGSVTVVGSAKDLQAEEFDLKTTRTCTQNRAMHKYFTLLANELNDGGLDMRKTLKPDAELPWTPESVKTYIWKVVQEAMFGKASTTKLDTKQVSQVYQAVDKHLSTTFNIQVEFPTWAASR